MPKGSILVRFFYMTKNLKISVIHHNKYMCLLFHNFASQLKHFVFRLQIVYVCYRLQVGFMYTPQVSNPGIMVNQENFFSLHNNTRHKQTHLLTLKTSAQIRTSYFHFFPYSVDQSKSVTLLDINGVGKYGFPILVVPQCHMAKGVAV